MSHEVWEPLRWLLGRWESAAPSALGDARGWFTFTTELDGRVVLRRSRTELGPAPGREASAHEDLVVLSEADGGIGAVYWDNEGHVIRYRVRPDAGAVVFESPPGDGPRFRLTYRPEGADGVHTRFEVAPPGGPFATHVEGRARRA